MHRFFTDESILDGKVKIYGDDYNQEFLELQKMKKLR